MKWDRAFFLDLIDLTKPRICVLALLMAALGFAIGSPSQMDLPRLFWTLVGLGLVGASSGAFNQFIEKDIDARMWRTLNRPLPSGRLKDQHALWFGFLAAVLGEVILLVGVNALTSILGGLTLLLYLGMYTPSKRTTPLSTLIGAIPGALPPLMGYTAARGSLEREGFWLFGILFIWQIPHFLAIAWIYREDYRRASLPILSVVDLAGNTTAKQVLTYSLALLPFTLVPAVWGTMGNVYLYGALILGLLFLVSGILLAWKRTIYYARLLFVVSILYLPLLAALMVWDHR